MMEWRRSSRTLFSTSKSRRSLRLPESATQVERAREGDGRHLGEVEDRDEANREDDMCC
jgi:hypothetical protein